MKLSDFDFDLPETLIATRPAVPRTAARLLLAEGPGIEDRQVADLPDILRPGDVLVLNDTKVMPVHLDGARHRDSAQGPVTARIRVNLLEPLPDGRWTALLKPLRKLREGEEIVFAPGFAARFEGVEGDHAILHFDLEGEDFDTALETAGAMPLPPYIAARRAPDAQDMTDYQTVFARQRGAVAAPTASLHFDRALLDRLEAAGVEFVHVTLHVGAGTFLPVKVDDITQHRMHSERGEITAEAAERLNRARAEGRRVIPVGTTALRLIESAANEDGTLAAWQGSTDIFITPGYRFRVTDGLMTNFHLPKSTLMMLVSALMGADTIRNIYRHAIDTGYRFFSYGDSSLLLPETGAGARKVAQRS
ncbi:tRNA preQ1(34) S-adenosylmethionine ribosyltransferase-isomerase QueA [Brevirhabdus pacifica]|uniref:S-adenosylmethionine:tRNA ribosyltransferase-isomerase n=1 Tax=Brevirhabdus pacifica TaxID=1267768 RepID=A0A1U7DL27_9RHOB|nr:tRNA preQ1(34) S-adenosylmethionine ribosyltransferase-isomerase QueA [Brevirhabdus pacifica]APX90704.1 tRNA preQ1(34) S-adenosylmethionine ribosyltransferase-isomerase QueA [Brevirhabdus pacifica]OWU78320.1 S-adenosylmethionine tRNA ribosyltransferase [Loktanella sp. 22II-4b]PJJ85140.1 S-adenosylmethionine:tRNA ribosyltransferase-isomerase [Brevirhabdus pacifica]